MTNKNKMTNNSNEISLRTAALTAGLAILAMAILAPISELYIYPKLVIWGNIAETVKNIMANETLFRECIFCYLMTFLCDILAAWALYVLLKPVNENLSLLTGWFRLVYAVISLVAVINLVTVLKLLNDADLVKTMQPDQLNTQVNISLHAFKDGWYFGILFFGIHLGFLGYLVLRSTYIPKILGILLILAGLGYTINAIKPFLFPDINVDFAKYTFYGELIFMLWLIIRGPRIQESN